MTTCTWVCLGKIVCDLITQYELHRKMDNKLFCQLCQLRYLCATSRIIWYNFSIPKPEIPIIEMRTVVQTLREYV